MKEQEGWRTKLTIGTFPSQVCGVSQQLSSYFIFQMVMAVFAYIYHQSFIAPHNFSVEIILDQVRIIL
jgi:hypothetical protein